MKFTYIQSFSTVSRSFHECINDKNSCCRVRAIVWVWGSLGILREVCLVSKTFKRQGKIVSSKK